MAKAAPMQTAFSSGELSPRMAGRVDNARYGTGCYVLENFIPDIAGPAVKRGGTKYTAAVKTAANRTWLVRFEKSASEAFVLEFGDGYIRFIQDRARVSVSGVAAYNNATAYTPGDLVVQGGINYYCKASTTGNAPPNATYWHPLTGSIYEIPSPYATADLENSDGGFAVAYVQSGDIIYLAHRSHAPRKLSHFGATDWVLDEYDAEGGPFKDVNTTTTTVYSDANTGSVTLTASASIFTSSMVGTKFYLEQRTVNDIKAWEVGKSINTNDVRRSDGKNYRALNTATTGTITPTHTEGSVYDGDTGVQWEFLDAGYGWVEITGYTSATVVTATVLSRIPDGAVGSGNASTKWAYGAWSSADGFPDAVTFYLERLVFARDQQLWMSVAGDYENMQAREFGRQLTDSAISLPIPSRRGNRVLWMENLEAGLVCGTGSDEWLVAPASSNEPLGPANISANPLGMVGSRAIPPVRMFDSVVFSQRSGRKLRELRYSPSEGALRADLNATADHIAGTGFTSIAHTAEPHSMIWASTADGGLCGAVYYPEQQVLGWARFPFAGFVECVLSLPSPDGRVDDLWLIVRRTINGATTRYVEYMSAPLGDTDDQEDAFYVDAGITYDSTATATVTGLGHLEGETVNVLTDGATHPQRTVASGQISLQRSASVVHVGLPFTAKLATMDIEAGSRNGTSQGKNKRVSKGTIRLHRTLGGKMGPSPDKLDTLQFRAASVPMGSPPPLFTGDKATAWPGGSDNQARLWFVHEDPTPATVVSFMPTITTEDG